MTVLNTEGSSAKIVVIVPTFDQPRLLAQALNSLCAQSIFDHLHVVIVSDGGNLPSQAQVINGYCRRYSNISAVWSNNGGPGQARNIGIELALKHLGDFEWVFFLDSDNLMEPWSFEALLTRPETATADWIYSDMHMFGVPEIHSVAGAYNPYVHLFLNYCDSGCLVNRRVLEAGVRFSGDRQDGYEDWGFWLNAIARGFRGAHVEDFGFRYRRRAASRFFDERENHGTITRFFRKRHARSFAFRHVKALENEYSPRFCLQFAMGQDTYLFSDPTAMGAPIAIDEMRKRMAAFQARPDATDFPGYFIVAHPALAKSAVLRPWLRDMFLRIDHELRNFREPLLFIEAEGGGQEFSVRREDGAPSPGAAILCVAMRTQTTSEVLRENAVMWLGAAVGDPAHTKRFVYKLQSPLDVNLQDGSVAAAVPSQVMNFRSERTSKTAQPEWNWKIPDFTRQTQVFARWSGDIDRYALPDLGREGTSIGFVIRICDFGGAEKVIYNVARELAAAGYQVNLFIFGSDNGRSPPTHIANFSNIYIFDESYIGSALTEWGNVTQFRGESIPADGAAINTNLINALSAMDVVINAHSWTFNACAAELRRRGCVVGTYLHLVDHTLLGRPAGHPYVGLAFEYAYDLFISCSRLLSDWLGANGVPREKLCVVPNAPGYPLAVLPLPRIAVRGRRLRVLFMGRLDLQKGIDRLIALHAATQGDFDWRIVGGGILDKANPVIADLQPPILDETELQKQYEWADIMVLLSEYEGVPLAILEAQRAGCVPVATHVGAVSEIVTDGEDGFLVQPQDSVAASRAILYRLDRDRDLLLQLSIKAARRVEENDWAANVAQLLHMLQSKLAARARQVAEDEKQLSYHRDAAAMRDDVVADA